MDQKLFNERICMSLLRQCAWVWEHCTKNLHDGAFSLSDILQGMGFGCSFYIDDVFRVTQDFCGNYGLVKKAVFFNRSGERYASLPEVKRPSAPKASRPKAKVKPIAKAEPTLADRLRAALLERLAA